MTSREQKLIALGRHKARTDLVWLARNVLGMKKIVPHVHGPMTEFLQKFDKVQGTDTWNETDNLFEYRPLDPDPIKAFQKAGIELTSEDVRRLLLAPRGWYKTSLNVVAHTIQWILNFPDITILALHASQEVLEPVLGLIKQKFWKNPVMRYYFPEFCPPAAAKDFGTQQFFNNPARRNWTASPTFAIGGIESTRTGMHYHVIKFTDIVDDKNSATKDQCEKIVYAYGMARNLLVSPLYWMDVEGTRHNFSDLYGRIIDEWHNEVKKEKPHSYKCFIMGCYKQNVEGVREIETFAPDELDTPFLLDDKGEKIPRFPEEFPVAQLEAMRTDPVTGEEVFNTQQLNNPVGTENVAFPLNLYREKTEEEIARVNIQYYVTTVDLAETAKKRSDYTVITTAGVDRFNRRYIVDIKMGKWLPDEIVEQLFITHMRYRPRKIKIEEYGFTRALKASIQRKSQLTGIYPFWEWLKRDTQISKVKRIMSLQPWYKEGLLVFSTALPDFVKEHLKHELSRFPKYVHDDVLDTLADQFQNEEIFGPLKPDQSMEQLLVQARTRYIENLHRRQEIFGETETTGSWAGLGAL